MHVISYDMPKWFRHADYSLHICNQRQEIQTVLVVIICVHWRLQEVIETVNSDNCGNDIGDSIVHTPSDIRSLIGRKGRVAGRTKATSQVDDSGRARRAEQVSSRPHKTEYRLVLRSASTAYLTLGPKVLKVGQLSMAQIHKKFKVFDDKIEKQKWGKHASCICFLLF